MNPTQLKERLQPAPRSATASFVLPSVVIEVQPDFVVGARLDLSHRQVQRMQMTSLEAGVLNPHAGRSNILDAGALRQAIETVTEAVGKERGRMGLLVSDGSVRVALLPFETVPEDHAELESLVRWKMKEHLPFPPEEARLSYQVSTHGAGSIEVLAMAAASGVLSEYESALNGMNGGLILPATAALLPLLPEASTSAQLVVNVCSGWITTVVVEGDRVCSWRTKEMPEAPPSEQAKAAATEAARAAASARDYSKVEIGQAWLCARPPATPELAQELRRAVSVEVRVLKPAPEQGEVLAASERANFERFGAPLAGLLANSN